jgi:hypothetical protein
VIEFLLSCPIAMGLAAFAYAALIWWMLGAFSRVGDE